MTRSQGNASRTTWRRARSRRKWPRPTNHYPGSLTTN